MRKQNEATALESAGLVINNRSAAVTTTQTPLAASLKAVPSGKLAVENVPLRIPQERIWKRSPVARANTHMQAAAYWSPRCSQELRCAGSRIQGASEQPGGTPVIPRKIPVGSFPPGRVRTLVCGAFRALMLTLLQF